MARTEVRPELSSADVQPAQSHVRREGPVLDVAFICTANRARSPFAAALLRRELAGLPVEIASYGAGRYPSAPALPNAVRVAVELGLDLSRHRSRPLLPGGLAGAGLVIGFEHFHVTAAVVEGGAERSRAFLLAELADALAEDDVGAAGGLEPLLARADERRRRRPTLARAIGDPVGQSERRFREIFNEIDRLVAMVAARLAEATRPPG